MKMQVWWIPQVPGNHFIVEVNDIREAVKMMDVLAEYDRFQFDHHIKSDYCNAGGVQILEDGEWTDWHDDATGIDDPCEYIEWLDENES